MEKTAAKNIIFLRDYMLKKGTTKKLEMLLYGLEYENVLRVDLVPEEIFHEIFGSNVSFILPDKIPKFQEVYPDYNWDDLATRGHAILNPLLH